ncbi:MAG: phosphoribosylformylglycinamidine cyclo-ligase [Chloroflexi bacterium]|nr:phosphoribosylformylglycinamidine cyclo-ligase [Chloroflexota bacterium]
MSASTERPPAPLRYADAGVDVQAAEASIGGLRRIAERASRPEVLGGVGAFAGLFRLGAGRYRDPVLVASADGVGTKLLIAGALGRYEGVGQDLVNHCVNDILTAGAEPLFFLDYLATAGLAQERRLELVAGIGAACEENGVALLGGETADMPDLYSPGDYDLAGFIVGVAEREAVLDGSAIEEGDVLIALPSTGLQTNGYSLVREIFGVAKGPGEERDRELLDEHVEDLGGTLGDALLAVHGSFLGVVRPLLPRLCGMAHITGGGLPGNVPRMLPEDLRAQIDAASWEPPPLFAHIQRAGGIEDGEMFRTFNMGIGMVLVASPPDATAVLEAAPGSWRCGVVERRAEGAPAVAGLPE